jgi:uncharacterized protein (UPF0332 family)
MSLDSVEAARGLLKEGRWRSSVSRSYYAAYCALSSRLIQSGARFPQGWNNPSHEQLPALIQNSLALPSVTARRQLNRAIRRLRRAREDADYRPGISVDRTVAMECIRDAAMIQRILRTLEEVDGQGTSD